MNYWFKNSIIAGLFIVVSAPLSAFGTTGAVSLSADPARTAVTLSWAVPSDAATQEIRYATTQLSVTNFAEGIVVSHIPAPIPNASQASIISNLSPNTVYYFGYHVVTVAGEDLFGFVSARTLPEPDTTAPAPVTSFTARTESDSSVTLSWIAPNDVDFSGYEIRYATQPITIDTFATQRVVSAPNPVPGTAQLVTVSGLTANTEYQFAIRTLDAVGNSSSIISVIGRTRPTETGGGSGGGSVLYAYPVSNLRAVVGASYSDLSWDTPSVGNLSEFSVRYGMTVVTEQNFSQGVAVQDLPLPRAGERQTIRINGLASLTQYSFGVKTVNVAGVLSDVTVVTSMTAGNIPPVENLSAVSHSGSVRLTWRTPTSTELSEFDIRYSAQTITEQNFETATRVTGVPLPHEKTAQEVTVQGLTNNTNYSFGVRVLNVRGENSVARIVAATPTAGGVTNPPGGGGSYGGGSQVDSIILGSGSKATTTVQVATGTVVVVPTPVRPNTPTPSNVVPTTNIEFVNVSGIGVMVWSLEPSGTYAAIGDVVTLTARLTASNVVYNQLIFSFNYPQNLFDIDSVTWWDGWRPRPGTVTFANGVGYIVLDRRESVTQSSFIGTIVLRAKAPGDGMVAMNSRAIAVTPEGITLEPSGSEQAVVHVLEAVATNQGPTLFASILFPGLFASREGLILFGLFLLLLILLLIFVRRRGKIRQEKDATVLV